MDHCWDGFYTCQKRESRFPTIVYQQRDYNIEYTGTPPSKQEFRLYGRVGSPGFVVTIKYNAAGAYTIYDQNRNEVQATSWDPVARTWAAPSGTYCGEFRYEGVINQLQFYIENFNADGCVLYIVPRDAVMLGIRLEFTVDEFFASGGIVSFTDRMAGVLGVHRSDLKVVAVYEGSTVIEFQVVQLDADKVEPEELLDLAKVERKFRNLIDTEEQFMGSNILDAKIEGVPLMSPFEKARQREGLFEEDEFKQFVEDQMDGQTKKDTETTNIFGDQTSETDVIE